MFCFAKNRLIVMKRTLYLLFISGLCSITMGSLDFHLIQLSKTYNEAKNYCRGMHTDLATVHNSTEMNNLITLVSSTTARAWIGLETGDEWMWHWPDQKVDFLNWKAGEPQNNNQEGCAAINQDGEWFESDCRTKRSFVCHGNNKTSGYTFVAQAKSWRNALTHCRDLSSELVSIDSAEKNEAVHNVSASQSVWIGLFKDPWKWSDGSTSSFRYWKPSQPNYLKGQNCVAAVFSDQGRWNNLRCNSKRNFICHGPRNYIPTTTSQTSTLGTTDLTTPSTTADEAIVTFNFTMVASTIPENDTVTTTERITISELATLNTTDPVSSMPSTKFSSATTEMSTAATMQLPPTATAEEAADGVSVFTPLMETLTQPDISPTSPSGNLILIQQNMSWIKAMSYCREHHIDLVHITTRDHQERVAEIVKNATSPHVWIGLRYTCNFNLWFWTVSTTGCYLNWAPGQGPEGKYDCGDTGAIEATGRQQWVGLSGTETLNFICSACAG